MISLTKGSFISQVMTAMIIGIGQTMVVMMIAVQEAGGV